jgi:D-alanyl-D-alanine carboxypeptidase (penicillin-binding protein 5/6)
MFVVITVLSCGGEPRAQEVKTKAPKGAAAAPTGQVADLKQGDSGPAVELLQRRLNERIDPSPDLVVDGEFGPATHAAVVQFQKFKSLTQTGVVDAKTRQALELTADALAQVKPQSSNSSPAAKSPADPLDGPPFVTAKAWAIADGKSGALLWGGNESKPLDMASTTKIMTALLVLRQAAKRPETLNELVTFSKRADQTTGSTSGVAAGEKLTVRELLFGLLLPSGNDAAVAFAEHFGRRVALGRDGDDAADPLSLFVGEMNRVAAELDLHETRFANPHGLPAAGHHTSARDLARLASVATANPLFAQVVSTPRHESVLTGADGKTRDVAWTNTNRLLAIEGYDGVKTGTTSTAGNCLVASGLRGGRRLIVVILGSSSTDGRYADARNLFRWAWRQLADPKTVPAEGR